jgi:hypothetical protein
LDNYLNIQLFGKELQSLKLIGLDLDYIIIENICCFIDQSKNLRKVDFGWSRINSG